MEIPINNIRGLVESPRNFNWAKRYYRDIDFISELAIKLEDDQYQIQVRVDDRYKKHDLFIILDLDLNIIRYECSCVFCNEFEACGHVIGVLLAINELDITTFPYDFKDEKARRMKILEAEKLFEIERIKIREKQRIIEYRQIMALDTINYFKDKLNNEMTKVVESGKYKLEVELISSKSRTDALYIKVKVGQDKMYIIKNINNFLDSIKANENVKYGAKLEFTHFYDSFDESSRQIIEFLKITSANEYYDYEYPQGKHHRLNADGIDAYYNLFSELDHSYTNMRFKDENFKIPINITSEDDYYLISSHLGHSLHGSYNNLYYLDKNTMVRHSFDQHGKVVKLFMELERVENFYLQHDKMPEFVKYVLQDIEEYLDIKGYDINIIDESETSLNLYGDIEHDLLKIKVIGVYEDLSSQSAFKKDVNLSLDGQRVIGLISKYAMDIDEEGAYFNPEAPTTFAFMQEALPVLYNYCEIYVSEALKNMATPKKSIINVGVKVKNNLLEMDISSLDFGMDDLKEILKSYRKKKKFHRLKNGELLMVDSDEIAQLSKTLEDLAVPINNIEKNKVNVPLYRSFMIEDKSEDSLLNYNTDNKFSKVLEDLKTIDINKFKIKPKYQEILREYQQFGVKWMNMLSSYGFGGILADDMGLGKTLQVIALIESSPLKKEPSIVVCPASLMLNWEDEIIKFSSSLKTLCINGNIINRHELIKNIKDYDIIITTYDYLRKDINCYDKHDFNFLILDEAQYIKNHNTKTAHCVKRLSANNRFALTGTPIENSLAELWSIFDFLMPNYLYNYNYFLNNYEKNIVKEQNLEVQAQLKKLVEPFILRRTKKEVLKDLPDKIEKTLKFQFSAEEDKIYKAKLLEANKDLQKELNKGETVNKLLILKLLTELRQVCSEPRLLYDNITNISSKLAGCLELVESLVESKKKILIFSSFTSVLDLIAVELKKTNTSFYMLKGSTKKELRKGLVDQFQSDDTSVFLISLKAGGTGLNLTAAQAVIHYDPWWNSSAQSQATDRAYRIGQTKDVNVFKLIMKDSIEEKILKMQQYKSEIANSMIDNNEGSIATMSVDDIKDLFK